MPVEAYVFVYDDGDMDLETIGSSIAECRDRTLQGVMGWRYDHPDRYDRSEVWADLLCQNNCRVAKIRIEVMTAQEASDAEIWKRYSDNRPVDAKTAQEPNNG